MEGPTSRHRSWRRAGGLRGLARLAGGWGHDGPSPPRPDARAWPRFPPQDVDDCWSLQFPQLYAPGQQNLSFNGAEFVRCLLYSVYSSLVLFFVPYGTVRGSERSDGKALADYQSFALTAQTCLLVVVSVQVGACQPPASTPFLNLWPGVRGGACGFLPRPSGATFQKSFWESPKQQLKAWPWGEGPPRRQGGGPAKAPPLAPGLARFSSTSENATGGGGWGLGLELPT